MKNIAATKATEKCSWKTADHINLASPLNALIYPYSLVSDMKTALPHFKWHIQTFLFLYLTLSSNEGYMEIT